MLADACFLLDRLGHFVRGDAGILLIAMYVGLAATDDEPLDELSDRVRAWVMGLDEASPLTPVVDAVLTAADTGLTVEEVLQRLFRYPAFFGVVAPEDRRWHSAPATDLTPLAFEFGHERVDYTDHGAVQLDAVSTAWLESIDRVFGEQSGDHTPADTRQLVEEFAESLRVAGIHPAWVHAFMAEDIPLPQPDGSFSSEEHRREWQAAVDRYNRLHPEEGRPDASVEFAKWRGFFATKLLRVAADDEVFARQLIDWFEHDVREQKVNVLFDFVESARDVLLAAVRDDGELRTASIALAERWGGVELAKDVTECLMFDLDDLVDPVALFVVCVAYFVRRA
ncbi:hypothetical protein BBK82_03860 [Lentzea guizhouensis]|uniref:Uncharacterized protein n=1 Tax=Lentzea guizhouensis TaxID=1586287 RepID=A0A1B2HCB8_9PSEU|nr:hypothetical protein BBK82_03860 [Lentzea guizhouensis]